MNYFILDTYEDISHRAADLFREQLKIKKDLLLGAATGNTPTGLYARLADIAREDPAAFSSLRVMKLDEWFGLPMDDPGTCETYIRTNLLRPLKIGDDRYLTFCSKPADPDAECEAMNGILDKHGPIDVCVLGIGTNGHIAFNEPAAFLTPHAHIATLAVSSQTHSMMAAHGIKPDCGLTFGMADIFQSRMILLLISGTSKRGIVQKLMTQEITIDIPASLLWLHPNTVCLIDRDAWP